MEMVRAKRFLQGFAPETARPSCVGCPVRIRPIQNLPLALLFCAGSVLANCELAELESPRAGEKVAESRPELRWKPLPGASSYRLQLQARIPEGGALSSVDTTVQGTSFRLPRPLTRGTATVKMLVTVGCGELTQADLEAQPAAFLVDVTALCPALEEVSYNRSSGEVRWTEGREHAAVEVTRYRVQDGRMLERKVVTSNGFLSSMREASVLALRPQCREADGAVYLLPMPATGTE
jgi:hypothetical protein